VNDEILAIEWIASFDAEVAEHFVCASGWLVEDCRSDRAALDDSPINPRKISWFQRTEY